MTETPKPRMKFDRAWRGYKDGESVVVTCSECGLKWAALALSEEQARRAAERHLEGTHGIQPFRTRDARLTALRRAQRAATRR